MQGIFVGTFLIGLREGLEATLIVSIIGAFLTRNGKPVRPMFVGVALAIAVSIAVGIGLQLLSTSLPQRQQEMLETVIGAVAVVFVTTMIIWMNRNAFRMKGELEHHAALAINDGGALALAGMAFLAVLKEGFETAVFLLAAAQASHGSRWFALLGGVAGIAVAVAVGVGIYYGSLKVNLGRFFRVTGIFLVFIAAGLVMSGLRTAHEAGWVTLGQQRVFDLSPWLPAKSVLGAIVTGMFGVPSDPRLVEVLGWLLYALPVLVVFLWPARLAPTPAGRRRIMVTAAVGLAAAAAVLALVPFAGAVSPLPARTVVRADGGNATAAVQGDDPGRTLVVTAADGHGQQIALGAAGQQSVDGLTVEVWQATVPVDPGVTTTPIALGRLATLTGGRLPVGLGGARAPGPFDAQWSASTVYTVLTHGPDVVAANATSSRVATLRGGGLTYPKTVSVGAMPTDWSTADVDDQAIATQISSSTRDVTERQLWTHWLPMVFAIAAVLVGLGAARSGRHTSHHEGKRIDGESPTRDEVAVS